MKKLYTYKNIGKVGRLGNQLWQIASLIGQSSKTDNYAYIRPSWPYRKFFSIPDDYFIKPKEKTLVVDGETEYFQDLNYWSDSFDEVHSFFQPSKLVLENEYFLSNAHNEVSESCAVHVRRGDYLENPNLFPFVGLNYYKNAFKEIESKSTNIIYMVFSDDIDWCKENFEREFPDKTFFYVNGIVTPVDIGSRPKIPSDQFDLFLISLCDYHIISNSTFSWWGSFLSNNKDVIYPSRWYGPGLSHINWKLMIPDSWIEVSV